MPKSESLFQSFLRSRRLACRHHRQRQCDAYGREKNSLAELIEMLNNAFGKDIIDTSQVAFVVYVSGVSAQVWGQSNSLRRGGVSFEWSYMDSPSLQASFALAPVPTAHVYSASNYGIVSMQGHDGLFARRLPIASTCFSHMDI